MTIDACDMQFVYQGADPNANTRGRLRLDSVSPGFIHSDSIANRPLGQRKALERLPAEVGVTGRMAATLYGTQGDLDTCRALRVCPTAVRALSRLARTAIELRPARKRSLGA